MLLAVLSLSWFLIMEGVIKDNLAGASLVDISGRQRLLSQQRSGLARQILAAAADATRDSLRDEMTAAVDSLERLHRILVRSDRQTNLPASMSDELRAVYFGPEGFLDRESAHYLYLTGFAQKKLLAELDARVNRVPTCGRPGVSLFRSERSG